MGGVQAVRTDTEQKTLEGAPDPRKDGLALGY
jgi:gamma-glutamyltranspeptidase